MEQVIVAKCARYERSEVEAAVHEIIYGNAINANVKGVRLASLLKPGMKVLVKPNLLVGDIPAKGITTHPEVVRAVLKELLNLGVQPIVGDSPGFGNPVKVAEKAGIAAVCRELGVKLAAFTEVIEVKTASSAKIMTGFSLAKEVVEADAVLNLPKMKTHGMARLTGCVKNLYGCIVGVRKAELHYRLQKTEMFMEMLIDLAETVRPVFNIVDAVMAMEGPGPRNGNLRPVGLIMGGRDPFAVDTVIGHIMGLQTKEIPVLALAQNRRKQGAYLDRIEALCADAELEELVIDDYRVPAAPAWIRLRTPEFVGKLIRKYVSPYPVIGENCRLCGVCLKSCPAGIMSITKNGERSVVTINDQKCIRCYCCQELCPYDAIELKVPFLRKVFFTQRRRRRS